MSTHPKDDQYYKKIFIAVSQINASEHDKKFTISKHLKNIAKRAMKRAQLLEDYHYHCYWEGSPQLAQSIKELKAQEENLMNAINGYESYIEDVRKLSPQVIPFIKMLKPSVSEDEKKED